MATLTIKKFSKSYGGNSVLHIDEMQLSTGIHWIKGQNGAGKTTFFKSLAGLLPHQGDIFINNQISLKKDAVEYRKRVNYGEAEPLYPGFLTAKDLVHFIGKAKGSTSAQRERLVSQFGVDVFYANPCETYSSGMSKKLSLVLAFLGTPQVIILDEPLITLDEQARNELFELINQTLSDRPVIFLISSHQLIDQKAIYVKETYTIQNKTITLG